MSSFFCLTSSVKAITCYFHLSWATLTLIICKVYLLMYVCFFVCGNMSEDNFWQLALSFYHAISSQIAGLSGAALTHLPTISLAFATLNNSFIPSSFTSFTKCVSWACFYWASHILGRRCTTEVYPYQFSRHFYQLKRMYMHKS